MNNGRGSGVEKVKPFQDLSAPRTQYLDFHDLETLQVAGRQKAEDTQGQKGYLILLLKENLSKREVPSTFWNPVHMLFRSLEGSLVHICGGVTELEPSSINLTPITDNKYCLLTKATVRFWFSSMGSTVVISAGEHTTPGSRPDQRDKCS